MKAKRKLLTRKCPNCDHDFVDPQTMFNLPDELELLAKSLELPAETVKAMIDAKKIPLRRFIDKRGRGYGPFRVILAEARDAVKGSRGKDER